jgi:cbb3-type cytochrome oxidase subunit 1
MKGEVVMGRKLLKISVVYFMLGISFGLYMSVSHVFSLTSVHVHLNLLGWMSLALVGVFYHLYPALEANRFAKWHFWLHNIGLPWMMIAIALAILGVNDVFFPIATAGGIVTVLGILCFGYNVLRNMKEQDS